MISVIVPTYNREQCLYEMLQSLTTQRYKEFEVLVIDQSPVVPSSKIDNILKSCRTVQYLQISKQGRCLAKNFAINEAKGDILLFCDDDIVVDENFLAEHVRIHYEMPDVGAASCHLIESHQKEIKNNMPLKITTYGRFINKPNSVYDGYVSSLNGGNMSFKKKALERVGYFDENLIGTSMLEEPDIGYRLMQTGYQIYFSSRTKVKHFPQTNGNVKTRGEKLYQWQKDYYFNQFFFMFRNKRTDYLYFIFTYLVYRTFLTAIKNKKFSLRYLLLPFLSFKKAKLEWKRKRSSYRNDWFTPKRDNVQVLKYVTTENASVY